MYPEFHGVALVDCRVSDPSGEVGMSRSYPPEVTSSEVVYELTFV